MIRTGFIAMIALDHIWRG